MIPPALLNDHLYMTALVVGLIRHEVTRSWRRADPSNMKVHLRQLLANVADAVIAYGEIAAISAADFYDAVVGATGKVYAAAVPQKVVTVARVDRMVRAAIVPLWDESPRVEVALSRLLGGSTDLALLPGRETIHQAVKRDGIRYAMVPQGATTCAFCLMLAARGAVYHDVPPQWHPRCDCVAVPIPQASYLPDINRQLHDEWREATRDSRDSEKAWLEHVRATHNPDAR